MRRKEYPHRMGAVYLNVTMAIVSTLLAFLVLGFPYNWVLHYLISTSIVTVCMFILKFRLFQIQEAPTPLRKTLVVFLILIACLLLPLLLVAVLDPYIWFILLVSFASGAGAAEVVLYVYMRS